jgi:hypothetical protein
MQYGDLDSPELEKTPIIYLPRMIYGTHVPACCEAGGKLRSEVTRDHKLGKSGRSIIKRCPHLQAVSGQIKRFWALF